MRALCASLLVLPLLAPALPAQDTYWVANRTSGDLHQISPGGQVLNVVNVGTNLRRVKVAPDGKLWVIRFIQGSFDIFNHDGTPFLTGIPAALGSPYDLDFDAAGQAWVSGGSGVEQFDPNGVSLATYPLPVAAPLGITVDAGGNKWIAHRVAPPASVSRIDGITGAVTNHALLPSNNMQPTNVISDFRGIGISSHIWVIGDGGNSLAELDSAGNALNDYNVGPGAGISSLTTDINGDIWIGAYGTGAIYQVSSAGAVLNTYSTAPSAIGLNFDGFGRLWSTVRMGITGPSPSEVRRLSPSNGALEIPVQVGLGTQCDLATRYHHALVVDYFSDADQDGDPNITELIRGTSPFDAQSNVFTSLVATGPTALGSTFTLVVGTVSGNVTTLAGAGALLPTGATFPGVGGALFLDPATFLVDPLSMGPLFLTVIGGNFLNISLPSQPALAGFVLHFQGVTMGGLVTQFTNETSIVLY